MERPRNERPVPDLGVNERGWGDRMGGGAVSGGVHDDQVWLNCVRLGIGVTARISADAADELADQLRAWARQARRSRPA